MYEVNDSAVRDALAALPQAVLASYLELRAALELAPDEIGAPLSSDRPEGIRTEVIGPGATWSCISASGRIYRASS